MWNDVKSGDYRLVINGVSLVSNGLGNGVSGGLIRHTSTPNVCRD